MKTRWMITGIVASGLLVLLYPVPGAAQSFEKPLVSGNMRWTGGQSDVRIRGGSAGVEWNAGVNPDSWRNPRPGPHSPPPPPPPPQSRSPHRLPPDNMSPPDWVNPPPPPPRSRVPIVYVSSPEPPPLGIDYWDSRWPSEPIIVYVESGRRLYQPRLRGHVAFIQVWSSYHHTWMTIGEHPSIW